MAHGGDCYGNLTDIDFSVSINPLGAPRAVIKAAGDALALAGQYPDLKARRLAASLSDLLGVPRRGIVFGNGASELITAAAHTLSRGDRALLPVPSFTGYEHALRAAGIDIEYYEMREADGFELNDDFLGRITPETAVLFLANPNNPTGKYIRRNLLDEILKKCSACGVTVVLDECFMELSDDPRTHGMINRICEFPNLLILRSFTKSFAIPGLRLGYMLGSDEKLIDEIGRRLPEWNVSVCAQAAGEAALSETPCLGEARRVIKSERTFLERELVALGFSYVKSSANFILFKYAKGRGANIYGELLKRRILIRDCGDYKGLGVGWLRTAVKTHEENEILIAALKDISGESQPTRH